MENAHSNDIRKTRKGLRKEFKALRKEVFPCLYDKFRSVLLEFFVR